MYGVSKLDDYSPAALDKSAADLRSALEAEAAAVRGEAEWKEFRDRWLGRKSGILTQVNELWLKASPAEAKREVGRRVNELKTAVEQVVEAARERIAGAAAAGHLEQERVDVTLPGIRRPLGAEHPVIRTMNELVGIFQRLGYSVG